MLQIRRLGAAEWPTLRSLRLMALLDSPAAFWATWEDEHGFSAERWVRFTRGVAWFVAVRSEQPVGLVGCLQNGEPPDEPEVIGMWVQPVERGSDVADALLTAAMDWVAEQGLGGASLWVTDGNDRARRFYQRHRFRSTGERELMPGGREAERMRRAVRA
jgi:GNAT superfamily N-acetyltransferase